MKKRLIILIVVVASAGTNSRAESDAALDAAVNHGLEFLAHHQEADGSFQQGAPKIAGTGLSLMAFLAAGHAPGAGRYGQTVRAATDFLVAASPADGYFGRVDGSRMYGQGIATLALAEVYGVETSEENRAKIRSLLERSVGVILSAQSIKKDAVHQGGWRYEPQSADSDLSLSGWSALALRAARDVGIAVEKAPIDRACAYVLKCYRPQERGFGYIPGGDATPSMTGAGLVALYVLAPADANNAQMMSDAGNFLLRTPVVEDRRFPYYAHYYSVQAAHQAGGAVWTAVWKRSRDVLINKQQPDGGWPASATAEEPGRIYATAMAVLTLAVPYGVLPIYQR